MITKTIAGVLLAAASLAALPAAAQDNADEAPIQRAETRAVRDPAMMPYVEAHDMLTRVGKVGGGHIDIVIRLLAAKTMQPLPNLEVALQGTTIFEKVPVADDGTVKVPLDAKYIADKAEFVTNKKKGALEAHVVLLPLLPRENPTFADMGASLAAGKRAIAELMPWYLRVFFGRIREVQLCYPGAAQQVAAGTGPGRPATQERENPLNGKPVYCAAFGADELEKAPQTVVNAPPGYVALFR